MKLEPFKLERYFAEYEFTTKYSFSSSDCDGLPVKYLLELADPELRQMYADLELGYTESTGMPQLRKEIAGIYNDIEESEVLVLTPEEGIFITMNTLLSKGDHVICTFPGYQSLYQIAESIGCELTKWQPDEQNNWNFDPAFLEKNIKPNTKLIAINFPHNPTGSLVSRDNFQKIVDVAKKHNIHIFSDEMYRFLELRPDERLPSAVEIYDKAISLFGMSKTFGMPGVRIGWVITKDKNLLQDMASFKDYTTICSSAPSEILSFIALKSRVAIIGKHVKRLNRNVELLDVFFKKYKNVFSWVRPNAGTVCFPKLLDGSASKFCEDVVKKEGILLVPSSIFNYGDSHFRIGYGRENMPEVLDHFESFVKRRIAI